MLFLAFISNISPVIILSKIILTIKKLRTYTRSYIILYSHSHLILKTLPIRSRFSSFDEEGPDIDSRLSCHDVKS